MAPRPPPSRLLIFQRRKCFLYFFSRQNIDNGLNASFLLLCVCGGRASERACCRGGPVCRDAPPNPHLRPNKARRPPLAGSMPRLGSHSLLLPLSLFKNLLLFSGSLGDAGRWEPRPSRPAVTGPLLCARSPAGHTGPPSSDSRRVDQPAQPAKELAAKSHHASSSPALTPRICPLVSRASCGLNKCKLKQLQQVSLERGRHDGMHLLLRHLGS